MGANGNDRNLRGKLRLFNGSGRAAFYCPGCREHHVIRISGAGAWGFNGDYDRPTFSPSVLVTGLQGISDDAGEWTGEYKRGPDGKALEQRCHSFVREGRIEFLSDCNHELAGKTLDMEAR